MKNLVIILFTLVIFAGNTQISLPKSIAFDSTQKYTFGFTASHDIQLTSIPYKLVKMMYQGGEISSEFTSKINQKQFDINRLGREFSADLFFADYTKSLFKNKNIGYLIEMSYQSFSSGIYGKDLFEMVFKGNQSFVGDTAMFGGSGFKHYDFQNFGIGLIDKRNKSFFSINLVNIQNYWNANLHDGSFFLSADSSDVELIAKGESQNTMGNSFSKGYGISANVCLNIEVPWRKESKAYFQFNLRNFGFAQINQINHFSVDTIIEFNGFQFDDFLQNNSQDFSSISWLDTLNVKNDTLSKTILLPAQIQFGKVLNDNFEGAIQSFFGIKIMPSLYYVPKVYLGFDYKFKNNIHLGTSCSYGGFGLFRAGVYSNYKSKKMDVGIGTEDLYGLISGNGFGRMFNLKLVCTL